MNQWWQRHTRDTTRRGRWAVESANATGSSRTRSMYQAPSGLDVLKLRDTAEILRHICHCKVRLLQCERLLEGCQLYLSGWRVR